MCVGGYCNGGSLNVIVGLGVTICRREAELESDSLQSSIYACKFKFSGLDVIFFIGMISQTLY